MTLLTLSQALHQAESRGLNRLDAQWLLLHALGKPTHERAWLLAHDTDKLPAPVQAALDAAVQRRAAGEPLAYITGRQEFYDLDLRVDPRVLVPRPDTETLVDWALAVLDAASVEQTLTQAPTLRALDLGTGSGAIALALKATRPTLDVSAVDYSFDALAVAQANAQRLGLALQWHQGSWLAALPQPTAGFDLIVSNPPYIAAQDEHLADLTHEPLQALASGVDGLDDIRQIITQAPAYLHPGGWLLLEHGYDQAATVRALLLKAGLEEVQSRHDLSGIERCSGGRRAPD